MGPILISPEPSNALGTLSQPPGPWASPPWGRTQGCGWSFLLPCASPSQMPANPGVILSNSLVPSMVTIGPKSLLDGSHHPRQRLDALHLSLACKDSSPLCTPYTSHTE